VPARRPGLPGDGRERDAHTRLRDRRRRGARRDDVPAQRIPPLHGWVGLRYDAGRPWLGFVELTAAWAAEQDRLAPQDLADPRIDPEGTDGWVTLAVDLGGPLGKGAGSRWNLGVHDIFDAEYRVHGSGFDGPGLGVVVGMRWCP
jgi:hypothetical protein